MYAICVESSHSRGMGHLFRALNIIDYLKMKDIPYIMLINNDEKALLILKEKKISYEIVDLHDIFSNWEQRIIKKYNVSVWINDRLDTDICHAKQIKDCKLCLVTFDDRGSGACLSDYNIAALIFERTECIEGKKRLIGTEYLILNKEIDKFKRLRSCDEKIVVSLGGSDTYGVTVKIVQILKNLKKRATIIVGPSFAHINELLDCMDNNFVLKSNVPSLIREFNNYDVAITGGGITPFEANAMGLPCIIIANELHEIQVGKYLERIGSSLYAGYFKDIDQSIFEKKLNVEYMSRKGMEFMDTNAIEKLFGEIIK